MASEYRFSQRVMLAVVPRVAAALIRVLNATLRYEDVFEENAQSAFQHPRPILFVFWHQALLASAGHFRKQGIAILISRSFDGELIARTVELLGFVAVRGSSTRGGAAGLKAMQQAFADRRLVAITADGPLGPKYVAKPGAVQLAQLTSSPVCAFHVLPQHAWSLNSWDGFMIPKPFSRVVVTYPARVEFNREADTMQASVQEALDRSVALAVKYWAERRRSGE